MVVFSMDDKRSENGGLLIYEAMSMTADMICGIYPYI